MKQVFYREGGEPQNHVGCGGKDKIPYSHTRK